MKWVIISSTILFFTVQLSGQDLNIHKSGGAVISIPLSDIDSLTFDYNGGSFECGVSTVEDYDGNVYNTVQIGDQCWLAVNLKTTHYRNGTAIENPENNLDWENNTNGAYVWQNNNIAWKEPYGGLYNWLALANVNGLCPEDWHVPSDGEWQEMIAYLGGGEVAGGKMKSTRTDPDEHPRWAVPNTDASNTSGFTGFPGGWRSNSGTFHGVGLSGLWWSSTDDHVNATAYFRELMYDSGSVSASYFSKKYGLSVRCVKD